VLSKGIVICCPLPVNLVTYKMELMGITEGVFQVYTFDEVNTFPLIIVLT
jgi:hypothetical protein